MLMREAVQSTRNMVYGSMSEQINLVAAPYRRDDTRLTLELDTTSIQPGMVLSSGMNEWWVKEIDHPSKTAYVVTGWNGSNSDDIAVGEMVRIRPRATDYQLFREVNRAILQMSSRSHGLYRLGGETLVQQVGHWGEFPVASSDIESLLAVRAKSPWDAGWATIADRDYRFNSKDRTLRLLNPRTRWMSEVQIAYRAPFRAALSLDSDLVAHCGLAETMQDIPALGAAANLLLTTESRRGQVTAQGDARRAEEVQPGSNSSAAREMRRQFEHRCDDEAIRLMNANPYRITV